MHEEKPTGKLDPKQEAALEAMCAQYEAVIRDLISACDSLMGDSDLPDDDSPEMKAMQRAVGLLGEREKKSVFDLEHEDPFNSGSCNDSELRAKRERS